MSSKGTRLNRIYGLMKYRCFNPNSKAFKNYGGRGITMCEEWLGRNGYSTFREWALENGYSDNLTIERIDVDGNYEPTNCTWILKSEQSKNRRNNHYITYNGETKTLSEWAKILGTDRGTLRYYDSIKKNSESAIDVYFNKHSKYGRCTRLLTSDGQTRSVKEWSEMTGICEKTITERIDKYGWDIEKALTTPPAPKTSIFYNGETHSIREWSQITKIDYETLRGRFYSGWSVERMLTTPSRTKGV